MFYSRHINLAVSPSGGSQDFGAKFKLHTLLLQNPLEVLGYFHVDAHASHMAQELHSCDLGAQTLPHRSLGGRHYKVLDFDEDEIYLRS